MKMVMCLDCNDVFNIIHQERKCFCGKTSGKYIDNLNIEIKGNCVPIGIHNTKLFQAIAMQKIEDKYQTQANNAACCPEGVNISAWIIPKCAKSVKISNS